MTKTIKYWAYYIGYRLSLITSIIKSKSIDKDIELHKNNILMLHHKAGQRYDKQYPYYYHLKMVVSFVEKFKHILTEQEYIQCILGALYHDSIEDIRMTYNDVKDILGKDVADIVYACTELRGKTRDERHGPEYINGLKSNQLGTFVKLCDICANMTMGVMTGSSMLKKYQKEYPTKIKGLYIERFDDIFKYIEQNLLTKQIK